MATEGELLSTGNETDSENLKFNENKHIKHTVRSLKGNLSEQILSEGELFICKKYLYVGIRKGDIYESIQYEYMHKDYAKIKSIDVKEISFSATEKSYEICTKVLKPFSKSPIPIPASMDWIKCFGKFLSIEKLFMFVLTSKSKDYSSFMELCRKNLNRISWDTTDGDGNTMIHYTTIMNFYPQVACDIIRHVGESDKYRHLICQKNNKGAVPLAYNVESNLPSLFNEPVPKACILTQLINSGASLLFKEENGTFTWKGGNDIFFGALQGNSDGIIVSLEYFKQDNITYRLCCSIEMNPICQLVVSDNFIKPAEPLKPIQILKVLQFPCHQIIKNLFPLYAKYDSRIPEGTTVINYITHHWSTSILEFVVSKSKTDKIWSVMNDAKDTILHSAILGDKSENVKYIVNYCPRSIFLKSWNSENKNKLTPLDLMIERNMLTPLELVFNQYEDLITFKNRSNSTLFHVAVEKRSEELLYFILKHSLSSSIINGENSQGKSPLMLCVETEFVQGIKILIESKYCNLDISENHGCNILHLAVFFYRREYFNEILSAIMNPHFINEPMFLSINPSDTARKMISDLLPKNNIGLTPLLLSMTLKHFDAARLLIEAGGQIDCVDSNGHNFLYFLLELCHDKHELEDFFKLQLKAHNYKHPPTLVCPDLFKNETLLYLAIKLKNTEAFELLLPRSTVHMLVYQDSDSLNNVLHLALSQETDYPYRNRIFAKLKSISVYDPINKRNKEGHTPLLLSVNKSDVDCVDCLLQLECDITATYERNTSSILHYAVAQGNLQIIKSILLKIEEMKLSSEFIKFRNKDNRTPLHLAIESKNSNVLELLLNLEINIEQQHLSDMTLLNFAIQCGDLMFDLLFKKLKQKSAPSSSIFKCSPQHPILHAIQHKNRLALQTLLDYEPTFLGYITEDGLTLLHYAIRFKFDEGAKVLIEKRQTLTITAGNNQKSILSKVHKDLLIAEDWVGYKLTIGYVLSNIPELNKTEYQRNLPKCQDTSRTLINIVSCQNTEIIEKYLRKKPVKITAKQLTNIASQYATSSVFNFLINCKDFAFDFAPTEYTTTAIHLGIYNPCQETFDLLLKQVVQCDILLYSYLYAKMITYKNENGLSALELAIVDNKQNSFNLLIKHGVTLGIQGDTTILHFFLKCENLNNYFLDRTLTLFSSSQQDYINFPDRTGCTPLHLAVKTKNLAAYKKIIGNKACKYGLTTKEGDNILHIAIKNGDPELFKLIIHNLRELEINVDQTDKLMNRPNNANLSPIFDALKEGKIDLFLNEPDIGIEGVGDNGSSLLHWAVLIDDIRGKQTEMMNAVLLEKEHLINSRDSNNQTPLHYAVINVKIKSLECLLQKSSLDLTCQDHLGNSALHYAAESKTTECLSAVIKHVNTQCPEKLTELLNLKNSLSYTPLHSAIQSRNVNGIKILLESNAKLPICLSDGTITFCNTNSSHVKVPLRLFEIKLKDESVLNFCVGFEVMKSSTWIVSDFPNLKESYLIQKNYWDTVIEIVSVTEDDLKRFILPCHSSEPLELVINRVQFKHNTKLSFLAASNGSLEIMKFLSQQNRFSYLERDDRGYSIHHYATENENKEILKYLCHQTKNQYPNEFKELSGTLLHFTIKQNYFEAFKILLEESFGSNLHYADNHKDTLLHSIVNNGRSIEYTKALLECSLLNASEYCNNRNANANTALHLAITENQIQNVNEILKHNPDLSIRDSEGNTSLHIAILLSTVEIITAIIQHICKLSDKYQLMNTSNLTVHNKPIHLSTLGCLPGIVEMLLKNNAELYSVNGNGKTILHLAVEIDQTKRMIMVENILNLEVKYSKTAEKNYIYRQDLQGNTPLHLAVSLKHDDIVTYLLNYEIDLTLTNKNGQTLLHSAIETQSNSIFDLIFNVYVQQPIIRCDHDAQRLLCLQDKKGRSCIHYSIELQSSHAVNELLSSSVCIDLRDEQGMTVLHYAAIFLQDLENISLILSYIQGVEIEHFNEPGRMVSILNASDNEGRNPLMLSIESTNPEAIKAIMEYNPEFLSFDKQGRSVLHYAANDKQILESIIPQIQTSLESDEYLSLINKLNAIGLSALHLSISFSNTESAEYLVSEGAKLVLPTDTDSSDVTIGMNGMSKHKHLRVGVFDNGDRYGHIIGYNINPDQMICSTLPQLNDVKFSNNTDFEDSIQQTVISSVLKSNCPEIIESLLGHNKINAFDKLEDLTLIELASQCASLPMMQFLCENYKFPFEERDVSGRTVIHQLIYNPSISIVDYLLQKVEDYEKNQEDLLGKKIIDLTDNSDCSPLKLCTIEEKWNHFIMLISYGADFSEKDLTTKEGETILHIAIKNGDPELFKLIIHNLRELEINVDQTKKLINRPNNANLSPIFYALKEGKIDLFLNEPDIEIERIKKNGSSLLHYAIQIDDMHGKQTEIIDAIIRKGEKLLNSRDSNNQTPLHYAVINVKLEALECLLQKTSLDLACQDHQGNSALHYAAESKTTECLSAIIKHVNTQCPEKLTELLNLQNSSTYTPLYSAIQSRNVNGIKILLKFNAKLPICLSDGTITFCNTKSSHVKFPLRLFKIKLKDESVPSFCVGFEVVRSITWIVSDLPNLEESNLIQKRNGDTVTEKVSVTEDDLKRFILPCHSFEPLELVINRVIKFENVGKLSHLAASNGSLGIMKFLSQRYAFSYLERDDTGYSIHHYAAENDNNEILRYLCHQTKNQHLYEFKELSGTLLHFTIEQDYFEAFKILLEESFDQDLHYTDNHEDTLLHSIVNNGRSVDYTKALLECSQFSVKSLIGILKRDIRNEDWFRMRSIIPSLKTSMSFEQKLKILLGENYLSRDLSRLISLMSTIERGDIVPIMQQYQKVFRAIPEGIFSEKFENEIFSVKLTEYSTLLELGDQFTPEDIKKLAKLPIIPSALCNNVTDGAEFLYILKEWGNHDPYVFYQELNAIGRSDLSEKAKGYPWLAAEHQTDSATEEMSLKTLVGTLKTEIREKDWFRLCLIVPDLKARMSFEAKMNILIHEGYIARDLTRLCELMSVIKCHDIEFILRNHQDVISIIPNDIDFTKRFEDEVAILLEETAKVGQSLL